MISKIRFLKKVFGLFWKGRSLLIEPLTFIVGDNGTGKTLLLKMIQMAIELKSRGEKSDQLEYESSKSGIDNWILLDLFNDIAKAKFGGDNLFGILSFYRSHGEANLDLLLNDIAKKTNCLILLDEPDQALSIRSCARLLKALKEAVDKRGCQVIASVHSSELMRGVKKVLSIENGKWMKPEEFIDFEMNTDREIRTVDERKEDERYVVRALFSDSANEGASPFDCIDLEEEYYLSRFGRSWELTSSWSHSNCCFDSEKSARKTAEKAIKAKTVYLHHQNVRKKIAEFRVEKKQSWI